MNSKKSALWPALIPLFLVIIYTIPSSAQEYGSRLGAIRHGGLVSFDPQGSATGHTVKLLQASALTDPVTVEVLPLTGLVRFHYSDFERPPVSEDDFD